MVSGVNVPKPKLAKDLKGLKEKMLTETELELMTILWKRGEGSVADVIEGLASDRDLAYTSVSTILRILEQKEVVTTRKEGRGFVYIPASSKSEYEAKSVNHLVNRVFDGTPIPLVKQLLNSGSLDAKAIDELKQLLNTAKAKR